MIKATSTLIAAVAALTLSGGAFAQNNTLATPSVKSPVAATDTSSGYGTPAAANSESGMSAGAMNSNTANGANAAAAAPTNAYGVNNTLARPSVTSPAGQ
ncbi:hypothetical protein [Paraburkholderia bannensis]|uniref:hypothetical protein n=1 Tax=Paraburkholderia bannensis TaxID=765414 RepID=UPI002AB2EAC7|nr:hypothetical protein [Paraburkholderia bannensis]